MKLKRDRQKEETKFLLEGQIETVDDSLYLNQKNQLERKKMRRLLIFLAVVLVSALVVLFIQQISLAEKSEEISALKFEKNKNPNDLSDLKQSTLDSLTDVILQLRAQNDRLSEFLNLTDGVFFEVWITGFQGFNAKKYKQEQSRSIGLEDVGNDYLLGRFRDFKNALLFENDMKKMGFKNIDIKGRINGVSVHQKDALKHLKDVQQ